jgi:hypothetical protein
VALRTSDGNVSTSNVNWVKVGVFGITERGSSCECNCRAISELAKEDGRASWSRDVLEDDVGA